MAEHVFLLFAGTSDRPGGGVGDLAGVFRCEHDARDAFRQVRLGSRSAAAWAQLAVLDDGNRIKPVCWFGSGSWQHRPELSRHAATESNSSGPPQRRSRRWATLRAGSR